MLTVAVSAQRFDTTFYSIVSNKFVTGEQKVWKENPNEYHYIYYKNDRGRGENVKETVLTNNDGQVIATTTTGVDYFKSPVTESYSIVNDSAILITNGVRNAWKYNNEIYRGTVAAIGDIVLRWLLKQPNKKGYQIERDSLSTKEPVTKTIHYAGKVLKLKLCSLYGDEKRLPSLFWMTEDMHLFGSAGPVGGFILKGYENWIDTLFAIQESLTNTYFANEMKELSAGLKKHILITHAKLFVSSTAATETDMTIEIWNGKVVSIKPSSGKMSLHVDTVINANGKFLMPGLWDMHCHYSKGIGLWYLQVALLI